MGRILPAIAVVVAVLVPAGAAVAGEEYRECRRITRQISHYEDVVDLARERDNELWEKATIDHMQRLADRRRRLCPEMVAETEKSQARKIMDDSAEFLKAAGKIALQVFTFGAYPGM